MYSPEQHRRSGENPQTWAVGSLLRILPFGAARAFYLVVGILGVAAGVTIVIT